MLFVFGKMVKISKAFFQIKGTAVYFHVVDIDQTKAAIGQHDNVAEVNGAKIDPLGVQAGHKFRQTADQFRCKWLILQVVAQ